MGDLYPNNTDQPNHSNRPDNPNGLDHADTLDPGNTQTEFKETLLVITDTLEEFSSEISCSRQLETTACISEIQADIESVVIEPEQKQTDQPPDRIEDLNLANALASTNLKPDEENQSDAAAGFNDDDYLHNPEWIGKDKHVFILSSAGKPIYSRYGNEEKLAGLCGIIQALVSVVNTSGKDIIRSIHTSSCIIVFLMKGPLILAAVSKIEENETQLVLQLTYVFNQIVSVLSLTQLTRIFEQRRNYDLRRLLSGAERLIDHLLNFMEKDPAFLLGAVRCLPLAPNMRESITNAIISACSKIKDLVFAILITGNQLVTLVRMKKYTLHPSDIHLLLNLVKSSESFKTAESWTPICLPKFDSSGFLHGHVSYLSDDCQACLMLLTVQRDAFFQLSQAKQTITEKLRRTNCLEAINEAISRNKNLPTTKPLRHIGVPEMRHFIYKCRTNAQLFSSDTIDEKTNKNKIETENADQNCDTSVKGKISSNQINLPNFVDAASNSLKPWKLPEINYLDNYRKVCGQIHCSARPAKLIYRINKDNTVLAWVTSGFELYATFDPLIEKNFAVTAVDKLLKWIKKEEERIFITNVPTF